MLTKDQANAISNDLLAQARATQTEEKNAAASRVPWSLQSQALCELEPWRRAELVANALKTVGNSWSVSLSTAAYIGACLLLWLSLGASTEKLSLATLFLMMVLPPFALRTWAVRKELRTLLRSQQRAP